MSNYDVKVTWGLPGSSMTRTTIVKTAASSEAQALSIAQRALRFEGIPKAAKVYALQLVQCRYDEARG